MIIALVSDLHSKQECIKSIKKIISREALTGLVCSGDVTVGDDTGFLRSIFEVLKIEGLDGYFIWGNSDKYTVRQEILNSPYNIHLKKKIVGEQTLFGLSYLDEYPSFDTSQIKDSIFVTHQPPIKKNLQLISPNSPKYHISGHLHSIASVKKYPSTTLIQVPSLIGGRYGLMDMDTEKICFKSL